MPTRNLGIAPVLCLAAGERRSDRTSVYKNWLFVSWPYSCPAVVEATVKVSEIRAVTRLRVITS